MAGGGPDIWTIASASAAVVAVCINLAGVIYVRGIKDTGQVAFDKALAKLNERADRQDTNAIAEAEQRGVDQERARQFDNLQAAFTDFRERVLVLVTRLDGHESLYSSRYKEISDRFEKLGRDIEHLEASLRNVAFGLANKTFTFEKDGK